VIAKQMERARRRIAGDLLGRAHWVVSPEALAGLLENPDLDAPIVLESGEEMFFMGFRLRSGRPADGGAFEFVVDGRIVGAERDE
jgi:hypothetical protein